MSGYQYLFADAAKVLLTYFENAAHNAKALRQDTSDFLITDTSELLHKFCSHRLENSSIYFVGNIDLQKIFVPVPSSTVSEILSSRMDTEVRFIMLGTISDEHQFSPTIIHQMFELHTAIFLLNACVATILDGKDTSTDWKTIMGVTCDEVMYQATLLEGIFTNASNMSQNKNVYPFLLNLLGFSQRTTPGKDELEEALTFCNQSTKKYNDQIPQAGARLIKNAFDGAALQERIRNEPVALNMLPIWFMSGHNQEDTIINDVWLPQTWGAPLLQAVAEEQARTMGQNV
jgi:hypothetical protein